MSRTVVACIAAVVFAVIGFVVVDAVVQNAKEPKETDPQSKLFNGQTRGVFTPTLKMWWDPISIGYLRDSLDSDSFSNIRPSDYVGAAECRKCHQSEFDQWSRHTHATADAKANADAIVGEFSDDASISYMGGEARFVRVDGEYHMRLSRDGETRSYRVTRTIGSRILQYYVGKQIDGPGMIEFKDQKFEFVLPFGYWISQQKWFPVTHVEIETVDAGRLDPYSQLNKSDRFRYDSSCSHCHTSFAIGDAMLVSGLTAAKFPHAAHVELPKYLDEVHSMWDSSRHPAEMSLTDYVTLASRFKKLESKDCAVAFGVDCEGCHLGGKDHAEQRLKSMRYIPCGSMVHIEASSDAVFGRTRANLDWMCSRCHIGQKLLYAAGMSKEHSAEFTDLLEGACKSQMTCMHCHDPHQPMGEAWSKKPLQGDTLCLQCHQKQFPDSAAIEDHTHHPHTSAGSRCMNCHMPKITEGLEGLVRTHTIFSPTNRQMIEKNEPNACNLCHVDKPIDWTMKFLDEWYNTKIDDSKFFLYYPFRAGPTAKGWLKHSDQAVRLVGAESLIQQRADWAIADLVEMLDDDFMINRQFTSRGLQDFLGVKLKDYGYEFYMQSEERRQPIDRIRKALVK
jgi:predicted CXXCH cytochrome family protein